MPTVPTTMAAATFPRTKPVADPAVFHTAAVPLSHSLATADPATTPATTSTSRAIALTTRYWT
jgi:hypothetical protein